MDSSPTLLPHLPAKLSTVPAVSGHLHTQFHLVAHPARTRATVKITDISKHILHFIIIPVLFFPPFSEDMELKRTGEKAGIQTGKLLCLKKMTYESFSKRLHRCVLPQMT